MITVTNSDAVFERAQVITVWQFDDHQLVLPFHVFDPFVCLRLRVYHERPATAVGHEDRVVQREARTELWKDMYTDKVARYHLKPRWVLEKNNHYLSTKTSED